MPGIKTGLVGGALICIFDTKLRTVILPLFGLSILSPNASIRVLYYSVYFYSTLVFHFLFLTGAIFYSIRKAKRIISDSFFSFKYAFGAGFTATLAVFCLFEFNSIFYIITDGRSFKLLKEMETALANLLVGAIFSLILGALLKSKAEERTIIK
jgi:hypothetical protein